ncbi:hypothetical protein TYRP_004502 [Tyrophagus putrescentiae]|nr:hypothetical protein TYRP_004502 [Tyrophagus putrescentiae]
MATTASSTVNAGEHLAINSMPLSLNTSSCSSSSAKTSLFDRVANFRRSLIKSQQKKNKIRPTSGTFNFFKSNFSSSSSLANVDIAASTSDATKSSATSSPGHNFDSSKCAVSASKNGGHSKHHMGASSPATASASNLRDAIAVDEEDAIYGFTSSRLMSSLSSADSTASFKAPPPPLPPMNTKAHFQPNYNCKVRPANSASTRQLRISSMHDSDWKRNRRSSAIIFGSDFNDLMIDDNEDSEPTSMVVTTPMSGAMNGHHPNQHPQQQHHRHQHQQPQQAHQHHHQHHHRNSHHLNGYHQHQNGHHHQQQQQVNGGNGGKSVVHSAGYSHLHHHPHQLNHSSDDLLLMAHRSQAQYSFMNQYHPEASASSAADSSLPVGGESVRPYVTGRIYENLLNGNNSFRSTGHSQHGHHKRSENRKLTKDSGYESASTLVSLTQLNGCTGVSGLQSSPLPPPASANYTSPPVHQQHPPHHQQCNSALISSPMGNSIHCRSDSLDSANSFCGDVLQSPSPPLPKCSHSNSPPLPPPPPPSMGMESLTDDLRPPTPPVRYSSLPQNRSFLHRNPRDSGGCLPLPPPPLPPPLHSSALSNSNSRPWSHQLQSSFDSSTDCQTDVERSSLKELRAIALAAYSATNLPLPPPPTESSTESTAPLYHHHQHHHHNHHHAKQDSWPMVSNGDLVSSSTARSGSASSSSTSPSANGGSHHLLVNKTVVLPSRTGDTGLTSATAVVGNSTSALAPIDSINSQQPAERQYQRQQSYPATPYTVYNGALSTVMTQSPSLNSLTSMVYSVNCASSAPSASIRHSIASCTTTALMSTSGQSLPPTNGSGYNCQPAPSSQIARSQRVHQTARQELCMPAPKQRLSLETSLDDIISDVQTDAIPPPPPLPPKNVATNLTSYSPTDFPPPPTPVVTESPAFPPPPTPLPALPPIQQSGSPLQLSGVALPPFLPSSSSIEMSSSTTPTTTSIKSLSSSNSRFCKQMFYCVDLSTLWPTTDFSSLLEPLPMPPPVKESNLDDDIAAEEDDEELASIEANRVRTQAVKWRLSQLELEQRRIEKELAENESSIGSLVRSRLSADATLAIDQNKLELLGKDMIMIIRLMTSIVQQLMLIESESKLEQKQKFVQMMTAIVDFK